jgi:actin
MDLGGLDVNEILLKVLTEEKGVIFANDKEKNLVIAIKEKHCQVSETLDIIGTDRSEEKLENYELPDGTIIKLGDVEKYRPPELLFNPAVFGLPGDGVVDMIVQSIHRCDEEIRNSMWSNIICSGGNTAFKGFDARLRNELEVVAPATARLHVEANENRRYSAWIGGSMLASLSTFSGMSLKRSAFDEVGESLIHRMFF